MTCSAQEPGSGECAVNWRFKQYLQSGLGYPFFHANIYQACTVGGVLCQLLGRTRESIPPEPATAQTVPLLLLAKIDGYYTSGTSGGS